MKTRIFFGVCWILLLSQGCEESVYEFTQVECIDKEIATNATIQAVKDMFLFGRPVKIEEDLIIEGYVVSNDKAGNFYKTLSIQDKPADPSTAISISIDATGLYSKYEVGRKIFINLKGLAIGNHFGRLSIGQIINGELEGISSFEYKNHISKSCELADMIPMEVELEDLNEDYLDMFISIHSSQFNELELGKSFADPDSNKSMDRRIDAYDLNCIKTASINVRTSGFADFKNYELPKGSGVVQGVLQNYYSDLQLVLRDEFDIVMDNDRCIEHIWEPNITIEELNEYYKGEMVELGVSEELIFNGYVVSSDKEGNFRERIVVQDKFENPEAGIQIMIEKENYFEDYLIGEKLHIKANRLYMDKVNGLMTIGIHNKAKLAPINEEDIGDFILNTHELAELIPKAVFMDQINDLKSGILIELLDVQLDSIDLGKAFAFFSGDDNGVRTLVKCDSYEKLKVFTSGQASFANMSFPNGKGTIRGVISSTLEMRTLDDIEFEQPYEVCKPLIPPILISEVADPMNSVGARFVELYNSGDKSFSLKNWKLEKYINGSTSVSNGAIDLSDINLAPGEFVVIANTDFESVFGVAPTISSSYISGNGDDVYRLVDSGGKTIDIFGVIGEDGNGKNWEYLDGGAIRKNTVKNPSEIFNFEEWIISSKSNNFLITHPNTPKYAPMDYFIFSE